MRHRYLFQYSSKHTVTHYDVGVLCYIFSLSSLGLFESVEVVYN